jgi:hypothetical protein
VRDVDALRVEATKAFEKAATALVGKMTAQ